MINPLYYMMLVDHFIKDIIFQMKIAILLTILVVLAYSGPSICEGCISAAPNCTFQCMGKKCEAYSFNANCSALACGNTYYQTYSLDNMTATLCVACNYTIPGCMLCTVNGCGLC